MTSMAAENQGEFSTTALLSAWPEDWCNDWYVCSSEGSVEGPLPAVEVFDRPCASRRSVARRGFAQWYDKEDFAGLWKASHYMHALPVEEAKPAVAMTASAEPEVDIMHALAATGVSLAALAAPVATLAEPAELKLQVSTTESAVPNLVTTIAPRSEQVGNARPADPRHVWLSQRAQARLGDLRNPVLAGTTVVLTFGIFYTAWLLSCLREVVWHLDHDTLIHRHVDRPWMAWIPGGHFVVTWELARLIRSMEEQDGYTSTKPWLAAMLALFPPLSVAYLQHALNDHWLIHCLSGCQTTQTNR